MKKLVFLLVVFIVSTTIVLAQHSTVEEWHKSTYVHKRTGTTMQLTVENVRDSTWHASGQKKNESYVSFQHVFKHVDIDISQTPLISDEYAVKVFESPGVWIDAKPAGENNSPNDFKEIKDAYYYGSFPHLVVTTRQAVYHYRYNEHSNSPRFEKKTEIVDSVAPAFNIVIIWAAIGALLVVSFVALSRRKFSYVWGVELGDVLAIVSSVAFFIFTLFYGWSSVWHAGGYYVLLLVIYHILPEQMRLDENQKTVFKAIEHCLITLSSILLFLFFTLSDRSKMGYIVGITISVPFLFCLGCVYLNSKVRKPKLFSKA